jgi:hypothetical protein
VQPCGRDGILPGARLFAFEFEDIEDASLVALSADPDRVLEALATRSPMFGDSVVVSPILNIRTLKELLDVLI